MGYVGNVKIGNDTHLVGSTLYGTCDTAADIVKKVVTCANFTTLITGVTIHVKFTYSNTASSPTLNVNGTGDKTIYRYGTTKPSTSAKTSLQAGAVISFTYDGTNLMMNDLLNNDTTYTAASAAPGAIASTGAVGTATKYAREDHTHAIVVGTGDSDGQVKIAGQNASVKNCALKSDISTLQSNFQDGVDAVYNAVVAKGSTPASTSLSDVVTGIANIPNYNSGTYTFPSNDTGGTKDLGINNIIRYVNAENVLSKGYNDYANSLTDTYTFPSRTTPSTATDLGASHHTRYVNAYPVFDLGLENGAWANRLTLIDYQMGTKGTNNTDCSLILGNDLPIGHTYLLFSTAVGHTAYAGLSAECELKRGVAIQVYVNNCISDSYNYYVTYYIAKVQTQTYHSIQVNHKFATGYTATASGALFEIGG